MIRERLRIVLVGPMYPFRGGIAHLSETMADGLVDRGHEVHAITFSRQYPGFLFPGRTQYESGPAQNPTLKAEQLLDSINPFTWWRTAERIQELKADCVIFRYWMSFFAPAFGVIARLAARDRIKSVVLVDNALPHERRFGDVALGRFFFKAMHGCVVMSSAVDQDLDTLKVSSPRAFAPHPVYNIFGKPADQAQSRAKLNLGQDMPVLLFFGFVREYKGLHVLLSSIQQVLDSLPNICLLVVGEFYESERKYMEKIEALGISEHVRIINQYVPKDEVANYFAAADVVVQPYISATQSGVVQIAYQFDTPVITTDIGGLPEAIPHEEAGLIVPAGDPSALAQAIVRYFTENMKEQLTQGIQRQKQIFGWDRLLDAIESIL